MALRAQPVLPPEIVADKLTPETLERELIFAMVSSQNVYLAARELVCPYENNQHRHDFSVARYNTLFQAIDRMYRLYAIALKGNESFNKKLPLINAVIVDWTNKSIITLEVGQALVQELEAEIPLINALTEDLGMALLQSENFIAWLKGRITNSTARKINTDNAAGVLTFEGLAKTVDNARFQLSEHNKMPIHRATDLFRGSVLYTRPFATGFPNLDRALGGGFKKRSVAMMAGTNGSGKTVAAVQFTGNLAASGIKTALFTTEQPPEDLVMRIASSQLNIPFNELVNRVDASIIQNRDEIEISILPDFVWNDPVISERMEEVQDKFQDTFAIVDWSEGRGYSIPGNFENAIAKLERKNFNPDVIIFDWLGGGLPKTTEKDKRRIIYEESVEFLVTHTKKTQRCIVIMVQLDKTRATGKTKRVTMDMLSECKTMTNNITDFVGMSAMTYEQQSDAEGPRLLRNQYWNVDKARKGPGGLIKVEQVFELQKFRPIGTTGSSQNQTGAS